MKDNELEGENCRRFKFVVGDGNYYITIGKTFVCVTIPRENDAQNKKEREKIDKFCADMNMNTRGADEILRIVCDQIMATRKEQRG